jgi:hypothetical protein
MAVSTLTIPSRTLLGLPRATPLAATVSTTILATSAKTFPSTLEATTVAVTSESDLITDLPFDTLLTLALQLPCSGPLRA